MKMTTSLDLRLHRRWASKGIVCYHCGCQWRKGCKWRDGRCDRCGCWLLNIKSPKVEVRE